MSNFSWMRAFVSKVTGACMLLLFSGMHTVTHAQPEADVAEYFSVRRANQHPSKEHMVSASINNSQILTLIQPYTQDTLTEIRYAAFALIASIANQTSSETIRKQATTLLVTGWKDKDSGINGMAGFALAHFARTDFENATKDSLRSLIQKIPPHYGKLVKLCGYLGMTDQIEVLRNQLQSSVIKSKNDQWSAWLALCRLGDKRAIDYVMSRVTKLGINDDVVYDILPDLVYTRHPTAITYLVDVLQNDQYICESPNPESTQSVPCAYRVMEYLAPVIKGFPLKTDASGDVVTTSYPKALAEARLWLTKNKETYKIDADKF